MAIVINGSGTVTGLAVGGLPDGTVDAGTLATNSVDSAELIDGAVDDSHMAAMAASKLTGALPAISAANLTAIPAANITGTLPAISGANLTNLPGGVEIAARGSNSNGNYFKFADGTMICTVDLSTSQQNNGATAGAFYYSNSNTWTYPVAFTGSVKVVGMTQGGHYNAISVKTSSVGNSSCTFMTLSVNSTGNAQGVVLFAIGVWN